MAGCADDQGLFVLRAQRSDSRRRAMRTEINDDLAVPYHRTQLISLVDLADHLQLRMMSRARQQCPAHPALGTRDDDSCHRKTPHALIVFRKRSRFFALIGTSGNRYSSLICPIIAK